MAGAQPGALDHAPATVIEGLGAWFDLHSRLHALDHGAGPVIEALRRFRVRNDGALRGRASL